MFKIPLSFYSTFDKYKKENTFCFFQFFEIYKNTDRIGLFGRLFFFMKFNDYEITRAWDGEPPKHYHTAK